ncbi:hypothetical protein ACFQDF_03250 [Ectobacillus funiculus]
MCKSYIIPLFTQIPSVIELASTYERWIMLYPISAALGLILYGVFTGATEAKPIRNSMVYALILFLVILYVCVPVLQNHGLWLAFILFSLGRSVFLALYIPKLSRKLFSVKEACYEHSSRSI